MVLLKKQAKSFFLIKYFMETILKKCDKILFAVKNKECLKEVAMSRRGENIFKRKDGRWEARYIHHYENGHAKYRYLYGKSYAEVKQKRQTELSMPQQQTHSQNKVSLTLEELAQMWLSDIAPTVKESTYTRYYRTVEKYIIPVFGKCPVIKIDCNTVNRFSNTLLTTGGTHASPLSPKSTTDIICVFKSILKYGRINGYPCPTLDGIRYPQKNNKPVKILLSDHERMMEKILLHSEDTTCLGILFTLFTGIRIGELCGLRWGDINFEASTVRICRTVERISDLSIGAKAKTKIIITEPKTANSDRLIPIPKFLLEHLKKQRKGKDVYLITGETSFVEPHCFYLRYRRFMKAHQIDNYTFHALRHTFATRCVESGFDTKSLSEILGHANIGTTLMFYVHPTLEQKRLQMERLTPVGIS